MNDAAEAEYGTSPSIWTRLTTLTDYFAWPLRTSHYLELVNPLWTTHKLQARVVKVWDETQDARTLTLRPGMNWRGHRAGQHVRVGIPANGKHYTRTYTISSPPERSDDCFTITVKAIDKGTISHHIVRNIKVGDYLPIGLPQGDFYLPDAQPIEPLFITAGSGITPAFSMISSLIAQGRLPDTCHLHYAPHEFDVVLGKQLREMDQQQNRYHLHLLYTREGQDVHFSAEQLDALCPDWKQRDVYACGPPSLLEAIETCFEEAGCSRNLHIERFRAPFTEIPADAVGGKVRFAQSDVDTEGDSETPLLRVAEEAGMNPPHGCRMGICHTCNTTLVSGCVRDLRTGEVLNEAGSIVQTCICAAAGDCELDL
ncbi:Flavodoxin reductases (ferredoxin-NADPH reductases) family 1 [Marinobacter nitratireducens]|uniref:Flavodoxin reductases (Ferredoxin-NADPH reductases) family 1 n=1 Tax=Marinobacter nitratireducens TaxID=1137280 RepID=A0A072N6P5_9GAMM|nr:ferredoxin reductase [Marinobacter nitratireducens]KEF33166.1 Flavodoxin reductases (ferredoxin-NADPH reductases) family 1 [Marinobacter nitratireducens]